MVQSTADSPSPVVTVQQLSSLRDSGAVVVLVDCRFNLGDLAWGNTEYIKGHLPGAVYADLEKHLSGTIVKGKTGRHPLPQPDAFAAVVGAWGIDGSTHVVAYDDGSCMFAPRLWWLLNWLGHSKVSVLHGGTKAWLAAKQSLDTSIPTPAPRAFSGAPCSSMVATLDEVEAQVDCNQTTVCLLDARAEARFRGEQEPIDPVAGHIPKARNLPFTNLLEEGGPKPSATVRALLDTAISPYTTTDVVAYCGSGVTACALIWAAACAGITGLRLYPGSWSEWITSPSRGVARG